MKASLLGRMILAQAATMLLAWALLIAFVLGQLALSRKGIWDEDLELMGTTLALLLQDEPDPSRMRLLAARLEKIDTKLSEASGLVSPEEYASLHQIFDREGRLLLRTADAPETPFSRGGPGFHDEVLNGDPLRVFVKEEPATGLRVLTAQRKYLGHVVVWRSLKKHLPIQILIGLLAVTLFTWLVARRALRPLYRLAKAVEARDPGDLRPLERFQDLAETRPLIDGLNGLFRRAEELLGAQRRFVADAAHELRTPLAVIGAQAHVLRHAGHGAQREAARRDLQLGVARAAQLVGQLLSVARLDDASRDLETRPIDLARLACERVGLLTSEAAARGQALAYDGPECLPWRGDATVLISAVDNLLVNAIHYTQEGGRVHLRLRAGASAAVLEVEDDGPGIPPDARETIFERFCRLPGSPGTGSGLGLAIVRQAVERHGGRVRLHTPSSGIGLLARIELPRPA